MLCEHRGRIWNCAASKQGMPKAVRADDSEPPEANIVNTLISDFWSLELGQNAFFVVLA